MTEVGSAEGGSVVVVVSVVVGVLDDLYELLAYNVSDCLGLAQLFEEPTYSSAFDLKAGLLAEYPITSISSVLALAVIVIFFITSIDSAALVNDMFATGEENQTPTYYRVGWAIAIGAVAGALLLISPESGIATLQEVVIIVALPFFLMQFVMMYSLVKGMVDDASAQRRIRTRQWEKTDTPEKLEEHEARPAPEV